MEICRTIVLSFCSLSLLYAMLQDFAAKNTGLSVIKLAATLYILITLFTSVQETHISKIRMSKENAAQTTAVADAALPVDAFTDIAENNAEKEIKAMLAERGYSVSGVSVSLQINENDVSIRQILVTVPVWQDGLEELLKNTFFCDVKIKTEEVQDAENDF